MMNHNGSNVEHNYCESTSSQCNNDCRNIDSFHNLHYKRKTIRFTSVGRSIGIHSHISNVIHTLNRCNIRFRHSRSRIYGNFSTCNSNICSGIDISLNYIVSYCYNIDTTQKSILNIISYLISKESHEASK